MPNAIRKPSADHTAGIISHPSDIVQKQLRRLGNAAKVDGVRIISELATFALIAFILPAAAQGPSVATLTLSLCAMKKGFAVCREVLSSNRETHSHDAGNRWVPHISRFSEMWEN